MWTMSKMRQRKGFAMVFVVLIALAMIIPAMILASSAVSRRKVVSGEAVSDRVLSVADAAVDSVLSEVNKFPTIVKSDSFIQNGINNINAYYKENPPDPPNKMQEAAEKFIIACLLSRLNGGSVYQPQANEDPYPYFSGDSYKDASFNEDDGSIWDVEDNIATYLYRISENQYYAVVKNNADGSYSLAPITKVGMSEGADILTKPIIKVKGIASSQFIGSPKTGIKNWDPKFDSDNDWIEIDTNTEYVDDGENKQYSARFKIHVTSRLLSKTDIRHIQRSIMAEASLKTLQISTSSNGGDNGGGGSSDQVPAAFKHAVWSGGDTVINGLIKFEAANIKNDGSYTVLENGGDLYGQGNIILNGSIGVNGYVITAKKEDENPIIMNGLINVKEGLVYDQHEDLPDFANGTEDKLKTTAMTHGAVHPGDYFTSGWGYDIVVNGSVSGPYYIGGSVSTNGDGTIHFNPTGEGDPKVAWYVGGDLTLNGSTNLVFNSPGVIWVHGDVIINGNVDIAGSGTIVSDGRIILNGMGNITYDSDDDMVAFVSEGDKYNGGITLNGFNHYDSIFYAPHSDIIINGASTIFGTVVAGGWDLGGGLWQQGVIINGNAQMIFDTRLAGYTPPGGNPTPPPLPSGDSTPQISGAKFLANTIYRLSWREIISDPVTTKNIQDFAKHDLMFKFTPPSS